MDTVGLARPPSKSALIHTERHEWLAYRLVSAIHEECNGIGAKLVVLLCPNLADLYTTDQRFREHFVAYLRNQRMLFVDLGKEFIDRNLDVPELCLSDEHLSPAGHAITAEILYQYLRKTGLGPNAAGR